VWWHNLHHNFFPQNKLYFSGWMKQWSVQTLHLHKCTHINIFIFRGRGVRSDQTFQVFVEAHNFVLHPNTSQMKMSKAYQTDCNKIPHTSVNVLYSLTRYKPQLHTKINTNSQVNHLPHHQLRGQLNHSAEQKVTVYYIILTLPKTLFCPQKIPHSLNIWSFHFSFTVHYPKSP
jgi:hypothetical protein